MPTNRTKRTRGRTGAAGLTEAALSYFWWGGTIPSNSWAEGKSEAEILKFWKKHRTAILEWYVEKNLHRKGDPGKRPEFFWSEIEGENPRQKIGTERWIGPVRSDGGSREITDDVYETDARFLDRLGLLEPWEKKQFEAEKGRKRRKINESMAEA
jgi:hypothetical protein